MTPTIPIGLGAALLALTACTTAGNNTLMASADATGAANTAGAGGASAAADPVTTSSVTPAASGPDRENGPSLAKRHFRAGNYALAEQEFRRATEAAPRDVGAWLGLAASCDRLKRFEAADRAYGQAVRLAGATPEILNNQGYSYMLRGDFKRAHRALLAARTLDPKNPHVQANLELLQGSTHLARAGQ